MAVTLLNVVFLAAAFRFKRMDEVMAETGEAPAEPDTTGSSKLRQILTMGTVHFLAVWALIYVGVEVTLGGWIVTFIQEKRGGGATAGYISSGFFGGASPCVRRALDADARVQALCWVGCSCCG